MIDEETITVKQNIDTIYCDGGSNELGHPRVYYTFGDKKEIICGYCNKKFVKENKD